jgi:5'-3' exonuclease
MRKILVFDITNMLYRTFFVNKMKHSVEESAGLAHHSALITLNKYFRNFKPHKVVMAFDRTSWRKAYTADEELCISGKPYKGNRRQNMTPAEKEMFAKFTRHLKDFEDMMDRKTSVVCLAGDGLEADDLIAGVVEEFADEEVIIVSADKDLIQLLRNENVKLIDPATGEDRRKLLDKDYDGDVDYFMFEKCVRGDTGDNVQSAFPGVRKTRIKKAYTDAFEQVNMMNETWTIGHVGDDDYKEFIVKELFEENKLLMDLSAQPDVIKDRIKQTIESGFEDPGAYSHFHFLKFLGKYELKKISEQVDNFVKMLSR